MVSVLGDLDKDALMQILTKPKNAIIRQYQRLFEFENVKLKFSDDALEAVAALAMDRKVGARGLRMILEDLMLDLMYYLPCYRKVREFLRDQRDGHDAEDQPRPAGESGLVCWEAACGCREGSESQHSRGALLPRGKSNHREKC